MRGNNYTKRSNIIKIEISKKKKDEHKKVYKYIKMSMIRTDEGGGKYQRGDGWKCG